MFMHGIVYYRTLINSIKIHQYKNLQTGCLEDDSEEFIALNLPAVLISILGNVTKGSFRDLRI